MKNCEHFETLLSTWLDGQLDHDGQVEGLDHVVRCAACREFYEGIRALDGWIDAVRTPAGAPAPSPAVWERIEKATERPGVRRPRAAVPAWAWQIAAVLVVAVGLTVMSWKGADVATAPAEAEVLLGRGGAMTDGRFVELTREVLQADRRYHTAMYDVMQQVVRDTASTREASFESTRPEESRTGENVETAGRNPV